MDVDVEPFRFGGDDYRVEAPVPVELTIQRAITGDVFRLVLTASVQGPCMRCLQPATQVVAIDAREYEAGSGEAPAELHTDYVHEGELDLSAWVRDLVAFALPEQILCRPDCAGLCPVCGKNLNDEPHEHAEDTTDPRWAALEVLRDGE